MAIGTNDLADTLAEAHQLTKTQAKAKAKAIVEDVLKGISQAAAKEKRFR